VPQPSSSGLLIGSSIDIQTEDAIHGNGEYADKTVLQRWDVLKGGNVTRAVASGFVESVHDKLMEETTASCSDKELLERNQRFFFGDDMVSVDRQNVPHTRTAEDTDAYRVLKDKLMEIFPASDEDDEEEDDIDDLALRQKIYKIFNKVFQCSRVRTAWFDSIQSIRQLHSTFVESSEDAALLNGDVEFDLDASDPPIRKIALLTVVQLQHEGLRRLYTKIAPEDGMGIIMKQVRTEDNYDTHCWVPWDEHLSHTWLFVQNHMQGVNATVADLFTKQGKLAMQKAAHIVDNWNQEVPNQVHFVKRHRQTWAFRNGIFSSGTFYPYGSPEYRALDKKLTGSRFFRDVDCVPGAPTPHFDNILKFQGWDDETIYFFKTLLGRLMFALREKDSWQIAPFLYGVGGSGKSTIIQSVVKHFYAAEDIVVLSNNQEQQFGLANLYKAKLILAPEIKGDFKLDPAEWQSCVTGEPVSISIKNKEARTIEWDVPMIMAGNELPYPNADKSGSVQRRMCVFHFSKKVPESAEITDLDSKLWFELGALIPNCYNAYIETCERLGTSGIRQNYPPQIRQWKSEVRSMLNSCDGFVNEESLVRITGQRGDATDWVLEEDLVNSLKAYCEAEHYVAKPQELQKTLAQYDVHRSTFTFGTHVEQNYHPPRVGAAKRFAELPESSESTRKRPRIYTGIRFVS